MCILEEVKTKLVLSRTTRLDLHEPSRFVQKAVSKYILNFLHFKGIQSLFLLKSFHILKSSLFYSQRIFFVSRSAEIPWGLRTSPKMNLSGSLWTSKEFKSFWCKSWTELNLEEWIEPLQGQVMKGSSRSGRESLVIKSFGNEIFLSNPKWSLEENDSFIGILRNLLVPFQILNILKLFKSDIDSVGKMKPPLERTKKDAHGQKILKMMEF